MLRKTTRDLTYLAFGNLDSSPCLKHGVSLRRQMRTEGDFDFSSGAAERAKRCCHLFCQGLRLNPDKIVRVQQVHGDAIAVVGDHGASRQEADGLCTATPETALVLLAADCPLVIVFDPQYPAVGLAHAGWRGTLKRILRNLVLTMSAQYGSDPAGLVAGIGPAICGTCFEVGADVIIEARRNLPYGDQVIISAERDGALQSHFDLVAANRLELVACGLQETNIEVSPFCTYERTDLFYSYRREGKAAGRWALVAGLVHPNDRRANVF